jgi:hypothetical protein
MKKVLYMMSAAFLLLAACNAEDPKNNQSTNEVVEKETKKEEKEGNPSKSEKVPKDQTKEDTEEKLNEQSQETQPQETPQPLTEGQLKEMIEYYGIGEGDQLSNVSFLNGEIKATITLAPNEKFPAKDLSVNSYSQVSDELLNQEGWQLLTITYPSIGQSV